MQDVSSQIADRSAGRVARYRMRIAWMYYVEGLTQNEIASRLGIGRVTVVRNLNDALKRREVKIWIDGEIAECLELERRLERRFGLEQAVVVPSPSEPANTARVIGAAAGMHVTETLADNSAIGVGWGETLYESLRTFAPRDRRNMSVISLLGGIVQARRRNPSEFAWQFAQILEADCYLLAAPAIVDSPETKQALLERCGLSEVLQRAKALDVALLSTGMMLAASTSFRFGFLTETERAELIACGAVGDLLFNFYNAEGELVDHPVNRRIMSIPLADLRLAKRRIVASGGREKAASIRGAMRLVGCSELITDEAAAIALLEGD